MITSTLRLSLALCGASTLAVALPLPAAHAQAPRRYSGTFTTTGTLQLPRREVQINSATLNLRRDGTFTLVLSGPRAIESSGRWTARGDDARLQFEQWGEQSADGEGRVDFSGDGNRSRVENLIVNGRLQSGPNDGDRFSGRFSAQDTGTGAGDNAGGTGNGADNFAFDATQNGGGSVKVEGDRRDRDVRSARVQLERGGRAVITLSGERAHTYQGRWTRRDRDTILVELDGNSRGQGEITLAGNTFRRLELSGREGNDDFKARFSTDRSEASATPIQTDFAPFSDARGGRGRVEIGKDVSTLRGLTVRLTDNGRDAYVFLDGEARDLVLRGSWRVGFAGRYEMNLAGDNVSGTGTMTVANGRIVEFRFNGKQGKRAVFAQFSGA